MSTQVSSWLARKTLIRGTTPSIRSLSLPSPWTTLQLRRKLRPLLGDTLGNVCPADELPAHVTDEPKFYVVNTDERRRPGKHWVLFYFPTEGPAEFFDVMGSLPDYYHRRFAATLMANCSGYSYKEDRLQCGHFCIYYASQRCRGSTAEDVLRT